MYVSKDCNWTPYGTNLELDKRVDSKYWEVREAVAEQSYGLDKLVNDEHPYVRAAVAQQGYGLDILVNDEYVCVRSAVAEQGYGLDILINDEDWLVRATVAENRYGLDILINDEDWNVREAVAWQGYGLNILINDEDEDVRRAVEDYLEENGYKSIADWAKANPDKIYGVIDFETFDTLKDFIYKIDGLNTLKVESSYESIDAFFDDCSKESFESNESIIILAVDTKVPLIKLEKVIKDETQSYKFIVDITNEDGDSFNVKSIISSKDKFNQLLESTINALNEYPQFSKYADDLENCL